MTVDVGNAEEEHRDEPGRRIARAEKGESAGDVGLVYAGNVGAPFEPDEVTALRVQAPVRALLHRSVLFLTSLWMSVQTERVLRAIDAVLPWPHHWFPLSSLTATVLRGLTFLLAGVVAFTAHRYLLTRRSLPREAVTVRADGTGLHADGRLVIPREDIAGVEVTTDPDLGFAVVVRRRDGQVLRIPLRSEGDAHAMAAALSPEHEAAALVFDGLSDARRRETRVAYLAGAAVLALVVLQTIAVPFFTWPLVQLAPGPWDWWLHPESLRFWLVWLHRYSAVAVGVLSVPAGRRVMARVLPGQVRVDARGLLLGEGKAAHVIERGAIAGVEAIESSGVSVALRDGTRVRLAFAADRPLVERDLFVARVRALLTEPTVPAYPSAETSGVRVAIPELLEPEAEPGEEPLEAQPPRARRRG